MRYDELGPECIHTVHDSELRFTGFVVVDNSRLGPAGGGTRMAVDVDVDEVAGLARGMTCKFAIMGLPRGGSKAGIQSDPNQDPDRKRAVLRAFGRLIRPILKDNDVAVGPDMGVGVADVQEIYKGAGIENPRSGLFQELHDGDAAAYHFTGRGVATAAERSAVAIGLDPKETTAALEGFGQVGVGTARYLAKSGITLVAVSTLEGTLYAPSGIDIDKLIGLRREHGDKCIKAYGSGKVLTSPELYTLKADIVIPGARPYVITAANASKLNCKVICPAANIAVTDMGKLELHREGILYLPDFIANAGGALASWVDFLEGGFEDAIGAIQRRIGTVTDDILAAATRENLPPETVTQQKILEILRNAPDQRPNFDEIKENIRQLLLG